MTISAVGVDTLRSNEGRQYGAITDSWAANSSQTDDGRFVVAVPAKFGRQFKLFVPNPYTDTISGTVSENAVGKARTVALYRRSDGELVRVTVSDAAGAYSFANVDPAELYFVAAFDDIVAAPDFNALIFDRV